MEPWGALDLVLWVPPCFPGPLSPLRASFWDFPHLLCWAFVIASLPLPSPALGPLPGPRGPGSCVPGLSPICPAQPCRAFPLPTACSLSRAVCFPSWGRGEACFSSLLRNRASETHNAAVKISGSGWAHTASPLFSSEQQPPSRSRGSVPLLAECWGGGGRETPEPPPGFCSSAALRGGRGWAMGVCNRTGWHIPKGCQPETFHVRLQRQRHWAGGGRWRG